MVLGSEESHAVSEVQKLLVVIYFSGPQLVVDHLLQSPVCVTSLSNVPVMRILFMLCYLSFLFSPSSKQGIVLSFPFFFFWATCSF